MVKFILNKKSLMKFGKWSLILFSLVLIGYFLIQYISVLAVDTPTLIDNVTVTIQTPNDNSYNDTANVNFTYNVYWSDGTNMDNCTLWGNFTDDTFAGNATNTTELVNDTTNWINNTVSTDAVYIWNVYCYVNATHGNYSASNFTVTVDTTDPILNNTYPANNSYINTTNVVFNVSLTEQNINTSVNVTLFYGRVNPEDYNVTLDCYDGPPSYTCNKTVDLSAILQENNTLQFFYNTTDSAGRTGENGTADAPLLTTLDTADPSSPGVVYHTDDAPSDQYDNDTTIVFNWTAASDTKSGIKEYKIYVSVNGSAYNYNGTNLTETGYEFTVANTNNYSVNVTAVDVAGNENSTGTVSNVTVIVDTTDPTSPLEIAFEGHPSTSYSNQTKLVLNWTAASDANGILEYRIYVSEDASAYNYNGTNLTETGYEFTGTTGSNYSVNVTAVDVAGLENVTGNTSETTIYIDTSEPSSPTNVAFTADPTTSYDDDGTIDVTWTAASDATSGIKEYKIYVSENGGAYSYNGTNTSETGYQFSGANGYNYSVNVTAINNADIENTTGETSSTTIIVDTTDPSSPSDVAFEADPTTSYDDDGTIVVNWTAATDTNGILNYRIYVSENAGSYVYNGTNNTETGYSFTGADGSNYTVNVTANDTAHNENTTGSVSSTTITVDTTDPASIETVSPTLANGSYTSNNWVYVNVTFTESNPDTCLLEYNNGTVSNYTMTRSGTNCYINMTSQPDGAWNYSIYVNDSAGREGKNGTFYVTVDLTDPVLNETIPADGGYFNIPTPGYSGTYFEVKLEEQNINTSVNVTLFYGYVNVDDFNSTLSCTGTAPAYTCTGTVDLSGIVGDGDTLKYLFNTTDLAGRTGENGTYDNTLTATADTSSPTYANNDDNATTIGVGDPVLIYANWTDTYTLDYAWLETNETGAAENKTSGSYGPIDINLTGTQTWSNFTWSNSSVTAGSVVGWKIYANDTVGNENVTSEGTFTIDNIKPTPYQTDQNVTNNTEIAKGQVVEVRAQWYDNVNLHMYWLEDNSSNSPSNGTASSFTSGNESWSNLTFSSTKGPGENVSARLFANDTSGNINVTSYWYYTLDYTKPTPEISDDNATTISKSQVVSIYANWTDNIDLDWAWLSTNETESWANYTSGSYGPIDINLTGTQTWSNFTWSNTSVSAGQVIGWKIYANDSTGNENVTAEGSFSIDNTNPTWNVNGSSAESVIVGASLTLYANWSDNIGLGWAVLETNETGAAENKTSGSYGPIDINLTGTQTWSNFTWSNSSISSATVIEWKIYANDTSDNENVTAAGTFTTTPDTTGPVVLIYDDSLGDYDFDNSSTKMSGAVFALNISVSDAGIGMDDGEVCNVTINGTDAGDGTYSTTGWCNVTVTVPSLSSDGSYLINITINDTNNNTGYNDTYYILVDNTNPLFTITTLTNGTYNKSDSAGYIWINGTVYDALQMGTGNLTINSTLFNNSESGEPYLFNGTNNTEFAFRNTSEVTDQLIHVMINYSDNATNVGNITLYFTVDNTPPSAVLALKNSSAGTYQPSSAQVIEVMVTDNQKTNDTITLNYTKYNIVSEKSYEWTTVILSGTPGTTTTYTGTIDITNPYQEDEWIIQYYITGSDNATNSIAASVGGSDSSPLANITISKYCGNNGTALSYCSYDEGAEGLTTGATNTFHGVKWKTDQLTASSLSDYNISTVLNSISGKYSYVYYANYSSSTTPWLSYDPNIAWSLNTLRFGNNTWDQYYINVTASGAVIRIE